MSHSSARRSGRQVRRKRSGRNVPLLIGLGAAALVIIVAAGFTVARNIGANVGEHIPDLGPSLHIQTPTDPHPPYNSNPPTSGYHVGSMVAPWGVQTQPISDEITVHNLEHGGVIIHYRQGLDQATVDQLTGLTRELQQQNPCIILLPRPAQQLDVPIAVTAWNYLLKLQSFDADAIRSFFRAHVGRGPEPICRP